MTGMAASGPMSPRPSTAVPLLTIATVFLRIVYLCESDGSLWIAMHTRATPGVYAIDRSSRSFTGALVAVWILPASCMRNVRSHQSTRVTPFNERTASTTFCWWASSRQCTTMQRRSSGPRTSKPSRAPMLPPASPMARASRPSVPGTLSSRQSRVMENAAAVGVVAMALRAYGQNEPGDHLCAGVTCRWPDEVFPFPLSRSGQTARFSSWHAAILASTGRLFGTIGGT